MHRATLRTLTTMAAAVAMVGAAVTPALAQPTETAQASGSTAAVAATAVNPAPDGPVRMSRPEPGGMVPVAPARVLDTRKGVGARAGVVGQGQSVTVKVTGSKGVPATGVAAVVVNLTAVSPTATRGYVTAWAAGQPRPGTSNLNFVRGRTTANMAVVPVGSNGSIQLFNSTGSTHLVLDVSGFIRAGSATAPGSFTPVSPDRLYDTRAIGSGSRVPANQVVTIQAAGRLGVPTTGARAVLVNLTIAEPADKGYAVAWSGQGTSGTSNVNYLRAQNSAGLALVQLSPQGTIAVQSARASHIIVDVVGFVRSGPSTATDSIVPLKPSRILDTRKTTVRPAKSSIGVQLTGVAGIPRRVNQFSGDVGRLDTYTYASAAILNVTAVAPKAAGWVTVHPSGSTRPEASSLNYPYNTDVPNMVLAPIGTDGKVTLYTQAGSHLIVDVLGYVRGVPPTAPMMTPAKALRADFARNTTSWQELDWPDSPGARAYEIVRAVNASPTTSSPRFIVPRGSGPTTTWRSTGLSPGVRYCYTLRPLGTGINGLSTTTNTFCHRTVRSDAKTTGTEQLSVVTWNLAAKDSRMPAPWSTRVALAASAVRTYQPDILFTQEDGIDLNSATALGAHLSDSGYRMLQYDRLFGLSVVARTATIRGTGRQDRLDLSDTARADWAEVEHIASGKLFLVVSVHLSPFDTTERKAKRRAETSTLLSRINGVNTNGATIIYGGDFNSALAADDSGPTMNAGGYFDAFEQASTLVRSQDASYLYQDPMRVQTRRFATHYDRVWVKPGQFVVDKWDALPSVWAPNGIDYAQPMVSDHAPIRHTLRF